MKSRTLRTLGVYYTTYAADNVANPTETVAYQEVFSPSGDSRGDHVRPTAHSFTRTRSSGIRGQLMVLTPGNPYATYTREGQLYAADVFPDWVPTDWQTRLYNSCLSKLNDSVRGGLDLSVDGFQSKQSKQMIQAVMSFTKYAGDFRREFRRLPLKAVGKKWLEYQYGWKPLLNTIYETGKKMQDPTQPGMVVKVRVSERISMDGVAASFFTGGDVMALRTAKLGCEMKVWVKPPASVTQNVAQYSSLNPVSIAWELLPYSFVVDWFINVGGYIRNLETGLLYNPLFNFGYVCYTSKVDSQMEGSATKTQSGTTRSLLAHGMWESISKSRELLDQYPLPRVPGFHAELGATRLLNAAALLSTFLKGK